MNANAHHSQKAEVLEHISLVTQVVPRPSHIEVTKVRLSSQDVGRPQPHRRARTAHRSYISFRSLPLTDSLSHGSLPPHQPPLSRSFCGHAKWWCSSSSALLRVASFGSSRASGRSGSRYVRFKRARVDSEPGYSTASPYRTLPHRTAPYRTVPHRTAPYRAVPRRAAPAPRRKHHAPSFLPTPHTLVTTRLPPWPMQFAISLVMTSVKVGESQGHSLNFTWDQR